MNTIYKPRGEDARATQASSLLFARFLPLLFLIILLSSSCNSYESFLNYNEYPAIPKEGQEIVNYEPLKIQSNDILKIIVSSPDIEAIRPFSLSGGGEEQGASANDFLVNSQGNIDFPTIGEISLKGLDVEEAKVRIQEELSPYFKQVPIVQVRLTNFKVNVNGEVGSPGSFGVSNNRLTIIEAVSMAGDFTRYSRRDSILIIREQDGLREFGYVDFKSSEIFSSPYFYLQQNDIVYVQPSKRVVNSIKDPSSRIISWVSAGISFLTFVIALVRSR